MNLLLALFLLIEAVFEGLRTGGHLLAAELVEVIYLAGITFGLFAWLNWKQINSFFDRGKLIKVLIGYILLRFALFDVIWNISAGQGLIDEMALRSYRTPSTPVTGDQWVVYTRTHLGNELVTNGTFTDGSGWTLRTGHTISGHKFNVNDASGQYSEQAIPIDMGKKCRVAFTIDAIASGGLLAYMVGGSAFINNAGTYYAVADIASDSNLYIQNSVNTVGSITMVSVKEII